MASLCFIVGKKDMVILSAMFSTAVRLWPGKPKEPELLHGAVIWGEQTSDFRTKRHLIPAKHAILAGNKPDLQDYL